MKEEESDSSTSPANKKIRAAKAAKPKKAGPARNQIALRFRLCYFHDSTVIVHLSFLNGLHGCQAAAMPKAPTPAARPGAFTSCRSI